MKKRTKQQKIRSQKRRQRESIIVDRKVSNSPIMEAKPIYPLGYQPEMVYKDLRKTLLVTAIVLIMLVGIYFYI